MHQRETARAAWSAAGLIPSPDARLQRFMKDFEALPHDCWPQVVALIRTQCPDCLEQLATPLWESGDTLLRVNLIRHADGSRPDEAALIGRWAAELDATRDRFELAALVRHGDARTLDKLLRRPQLPDRWRLLAHQRRLAMAEP